MPRDQHWRPKCILILSPAKLSPNPISFRSAIILFGITVFFGIIFDVIFLSYFQCLHQRVVNVLLLNGRSINITCNAINTTAKQILDTVLRAENLYENFFLGLCALINGDFAFLPRELKIYKVVHNSLIMWLQSNGGKGLIS